MANPFGITKYLEFTDDEENKEFRGFGDYLAYLRRDVLKFTSQTKLIEFLGLPRERTWISKFENTLDLKYTFPPPGYVATLYVSIVKKWRQFNQVADLKNFLLQEFRDIQEHNRKEWQNEFLEAVKYWDDIEELSSSFIKKQRSRENDIQTISELGLAPAPPKLFVGREDELAELRNRLTSEIGTTLLTAVRGWPGVGKTSLAAAIAHDSRLNAAFPDGVLWTALGPSPSVDVELGNWLTALGLSPRDFPTIESRSSRLAAILRHKKMLLIIDDVWDAAHAEPFLIGGRDCRTLITTREPEVVRVLGLSKQAIYHLSVLSGDASLQLLKKLAPNVVEIDPDATHRLIHALEGLPLALHVAGRLLAIEAEMGWGVSDLLEELAEGTRLLQEIAPADRTDLTTHTTPTIAVLLENSTNRLDPMTQVRFALLGYFTSKPNTFDVQAVAAAWQVKDPKPTLRELEGRGLIEPVGNRFQMHSLLTVHAKSMWEKNG